MSGRSTGLVCRTELVFWGGFPGVRVQPHRGAQRRAVPGEAEPARRASPSTSLGPGPTIRQPPPGRSPQPQPPVEDGPAPPCGRAQQSLSRTTSAPSLRAPLAPRAGSRQPACHSSNPLRPDGSASSEYCHRTTGKPSQPDPQPQPGFSGLSVRDVGLGPGAEAGMTGLPAAGGLVGPGPSPVDGLALRAGSASPGTARRWAHRVRVSDHSAFWTGVEAARPMSRQGPPGGADSSVRQSVARPRRRR
jgi:hypothetical protein